MSHLLQVFKKLHKILVQCFAELLELSYHPIEEQKTAASTVRSGTLMVTKRKGVHTVRGNYEFFFTCAVVLPIWKGIRNRE